MTQAEFLAGMDRLRSVFGDRHYPPEREKMVASKVQDLPKDAWDELVDNLISQMRYPPTPTEIIDAYKAWKRKHQPEWSETSRTPFELGCTDCMDTGWVNTRSELGDRLMYCHCDEGWRQSASHSKYIPRFDQDIQALGFSVIPFPKDESKDSFEVKVKRWTELLKATDSFWKSQL